MRRTIPVAFIFIFSLVFLMSGKPIVYQPREIMRISRRRDEFWRAREKQTNSLFAFLRESKYISPDTWQYQSIFADEVQIGERTADGRQLKRSVFHDFPAAQMCAGSWLSPAEYCRTN